jgi:mRNA interferase MazF
MIEQRDLLLVPFPFSDQLGRKVRPVVVVSNNEFNKELNDIVVVGVTSNMSRDKYTLLLSTNDLDEGNLLTTSYIKCESILKLDKQLVVRKIGKIKKTKFKQIISIIKEIIN